MDNIYAKYTKNGVISLKNLKKENSPLFKYVMKNYDVVQKNLKDKYHIELLNDIKTRRSKENLRLFLKYTYGDTVDLTSLRKDYKGIYNYLCQDGSVEDNIKKLGLQVTYSSKDLEPLLKELKKLARDGMIKSIPPKIYNKLYYLSKKNDMNVNEYLQSLGFQYKPQQDIDIPALLHLKNEEGFSFREISKMLNIPLSTIYKYYREHSN